MQRFAEKSGGSDTDHRQGMALHDERRPHYRRIRGIGGLPHAVAQHGYGRRRGLVVLRRDHASTERMHSQRRKVGAAHVLRAQGPGQGFDALTPRAQAATPCLECRHFLEFRCFRRQPLIQGERKQTPLVLGTPFHAAIVAFANPVEPARIRDRQGAEHHRVNQGIDCRGAADSQGQREYRRCGEHRRQPELSQGVPKIAG